MSFPSLEWPLALNIAYLSLANSKHSLFGCPATRGDAGPGRLYKVRENLISQQVSAQIITKTEDSQPGLGCTTSPFPNGTVEPILAYLTSDSFTWHEPSVCLHNLRG